jgi:aspartyl-tRNA(Asn)/glutamyl-tRNA(Gln) amidotransferase subunit C
MDITTEEVKRIAKLSKLKFTEDEIGNFAGQLTSIMKMINELNEVDCSGIQPLTSVCDMTQPMRKDIVTEQDNSEDIFSNAPGSSAAFAKEIKYFIVPKVVE